MARRPRVTPAAAPPRALVAAGLAAGVGALTRPGHAVLPAAGGAAAGLARARSPHRPAPRGPVHGPGARRDRAVDRAQRRRPRQFVPIASSRRRHLLDRQPPRGDRRRRSRRQPAPQAAATPSSAPAHAGLSEEALEPLYYREALRLHRRRSACGGSGSRRESSGTRSCRSARRTGCTRRAISGRRRCRCSCCSRRPSSGSSGRAVGHAPGRAPDARRVDRPGRPGVLPAGAVPAAGDGSGAHRRGRALRVAPAVTTPSCNLSRAVHTVAPSPSSAVTTPTAAVPTTLVLIPTYNERENLPGLVRAVLAHPGFRVMVVDDRSPDGTGEVADALAREFPGRVEVLHRTGKKGLGRSYIEALHAGARPHRGLRLPDGRRPLARPQVPARDGGDGAARRPRPGHRLALPAGRQRRQLAAAPADPEHVRQPLHPRRSPGCPSPTAPAASAAGAAKRWPRCRSSAIVSDGYAFLVEMLYEAHRSGCSIGEVPIIFVERRVGQSKLSGGVIFESAYHAVARWCCGAATRR